MNFITVEPQYAPHVALISLNRPKELNALNLELMSELRDALAALDKDEQVRVIILTGNERAFAAGADIKQMAGKTAIDMLMVDQFSTWDQIKKTKKPLIAAVSGLLRRNPQTPRNPGPAGYRSCAWVVSRLTRCVP